MFRSFLVALAFTASVSSAVTTRRLRVAGITNWEIGAVTDLPECDFDAISLAFPDTTVGECEGATATSFNDWPGMTWDASQTTAFCGSTACSTMLDSFNALPDCVVSEADNMRWKDSIFTGLQCATEPAPVEPTPIEPLPEDPLSVDPIFIDPLPVDPVPVDPVPVDPIPVDPPAPVDPAPVAPAPADPVPVPIASTSSHCGDGQQEISVEGVEAVFCLPADVTMCSGDVATGTCPDADPTNGLAFGSYCALVRNPNVHGCRPYKDESRTPSTDPIQDALDCSADPNGNTAVSVAGGVTGCSQQPVCSGTNFGTCPVGATCVHVQPNVYGCSLAA